MDKGSFSQGWRCSKPTPEGKGSIKLIVEEASQQDKYSTKGELQE